MGGGGGTVGPAVKGGERAGGKGGRGAAGQVVSGQHCSPASRCCHSPPLPSTNAAWGILESLFPAPCPLSGEGEGKSPAWGGCGGRRGNEGTDQTPRNRTCSGVSPCSSEPQQRLRQRWGSRERGRGRPLKRQQLQYGGCWGQGPGEGRLSSWGGRWLRAPWPAGRKLQAPR